MLSDIELVDQFAADLGDDYRVAKSYVRDVPTQALLHVRSFTHRLTGKLGALQGLALDSPNLYDRIETLNRQRVIDVRLTRTLHKLRTDGNRGAHPEKYHLTPEALQQLAENAITRLLQLVVALYPLMCRCDAPAYRFEPFDAHAGRDLCYRAIMENDPQAQYLVGMSLKTRASMYREREQALYAPGEAARLPCSDDMFKQAAYWFAQAAGQLAEAHYEHGVCLLHGYGVEADRAAGERAILAAAEAGVVNAMALVGYFYLVGGAHIAADPHKAYRYLRAAADRKQSEAMANLGVFYYQQGDSPQAYRYIFSAAQSGFPHAQYHLALMLARGEGCPQDLLASERWMAEAAEQGQLDAKLHCAQQMLHNEAALGSDFALAERYLWEAVKYGHSVPAMIELSVALADGVLGRIDVVESAALLQLAQTRGNEQERAVIAPLWTSLTLQIANVLEMTQDAEERRALLRAQALLAEQ